MINPSLKTGRVKNFLTHGEMTEFRKHFLSTKPVKSNLMDDIYGIDYKNVSHYLWFKKTMWKKLTKFLAKDVNLAVAMFCKFTNSFKIHNDYGKYLESKNMKSHVVCLIPFSVNQDVKQCKKSQTLIFEKGENANAYEDHKKFLSNNPIERVKQYKIIKVHEWKSGDLIWWRSDMDHAGSHFTDSIKEKECWSIHTYV
jgi:hypothetical protein|tara:strand:- start:986 stop:1579 length:594 start_codon:yes stop_codon:yes gene_type:complete